MSLGLPAALVLVLVACATAAAVVLSGAPPSVSPRRLRKPLSARASSGRATLPRRRRSAAAAPAAASPLLSALAADLIAAALRAGSPLSAALEAVGHALPPASSDPEDHSEVGRLLSSAGRALLLGATLEHALDPLREVRPRRTGSASDAAAVMPRLADVVHRSSGSGAKLAEQLTLLADDLRVESAASDLAGARRRGVLAVLPLGGCLLPAFMLLAVVPTVAGLVAVLAS